MIRRRKTLLPAQQAALVAYEPHLSAETRKALEGEGTPPVDDDWDAEDPFWGVQKEEVPAGNKGRTLKGDLVGVMRLLGL